ncbi:hypothetical protein XELAEV_18046481mg [Xenopus laevis]|uniref:Uncharacterized protein n=1 Tax=Xenopus laevis TaxID=8355 RepID=A0A974BTP5_XENLA|nr:hypothetical protein XELAEV_18046481mg [Xenopus laevis]
MSNLISAFTKLKQHNLFKRYISNDIHSQFNQIKQIVNKNLSILQGAELRACSLANLLWTPKTSRPKIHNQVLKQAIGLWDQTHKWYKLKSPHAPLLGWSLNPAFPLGMLDNFEWWHRAGLSRIWDLTRMGVLPSPLTLREKCKGQDKVLSPVTLFEHICISKPLGPKSVSLLYKDLISTIPFLHLKYINDWHQELGDAQPEEVWNEILLQPTKCSINASIQETSFKVLLRWYMVPVKLAKWFLAQSWRTSSLDFNMVKHKVDNVMRWKYCRQNLQDAKWIFFLRTRQPTGMNLDYNVSCFI